MRAPWKFTRGIKLAVRGRASPVRPLRSATIRIVSDPGPVEESLRHRLDATNGAPLLALSQAGSGLYAAYPSASTNGTIH